MTSDDEWCNDTVSDYSEEYEEEESINSEEETMYDRVWVKNFQGSGKAALVMRYHRYSMSLTARRQCINAITGNRYVDENGNAIYHGSKESTRLYGVNDITAERERFDTVRLYYNNPEEFEHHLGVTLPPASKKEWYDRHKLVK